MTNPAYIASAPFTFAFKFMLAAVCGWIAWAKGSRAENHGQNILAAIAGSATYMVLYLGKSFIEGMLLGSALSCAPLRGHKGCHLWGERRHRGDCVRASVRGHPAGLEKEPPAGKAGMTTFLGAPLLPAKAGQKNF